MRNPLTNRAIFVLSLVGLLIAGLLWKLHATPQWIPCGGNNGCETVALSPYSRLPVGTGPPIAMYGTIGYLAILLLTFARTMPSVAANSHMDRMAAGLILAGAIFGMAFSLRLTYMELSPAYINAICRWCMASQMIIFLVFILSLTEVVQARRSNGISSVAEEGAR